MKFKSAASLKYTYIVFHIHYFRNCSTSGSSLGKHLVVGCFPEAHKWGS